MRQWMMVNGGKEIVLNGVEEGTATYTEIFFCKLGAAKNVRFWPFKHENEVDLSDRSMLRCGKTLRHA